MFGNAKMKYEINSIKSFPFQISLFTRFEQKLNKLYSFPTSETQMSANETVQLE